VTGALAAGQPVVTGLPSELMALSGGVRVTAGAR
jgi:hypothetical protein